jgi:hypothetical protein
MHKFQTGVRLQLEKLRFESAPSFRRGESYPENRPIKTRILDKFLALHLVAGVGTSWSNRVQEGSRWI